VKDLKSELGGNFEELALALMMKPREFDAYCLKKAMAGAGTTESVSSFATTAACAVSKHVVMLKRKQLPC